MPFCYFLCKMEEIGMEAHCLMKKLCILCLCLCLTFYGCGYDPYDPTMFGYYEGTVIIAEGYEIPMSRIYDGENYILLGENGGGVLTLAGDSHEIQWGFRGQRFILELDGRKSEGSIENGILKLNYLDMGMELQFHAAPDYTPGKGWELTEQALLWQGDWYGWWMVDEATGSFAEVAGDWWDLCATVTMESNSRGRICLWDQDGSAEGLLGEVSFYIDERGSAVSQEGYFGATIIGQGDWYIEPYRHEPGDLLVISCGAENDTGTFYYTAYLRPWGQDWSDVQEKPYHYEDWYLPLIRGGQPMPQALPQ